MKRILQEENIHQDQLDKPLTTQAFATCFSNASTIKPLIKTLIQVSEVKNKTSNGTTVLVLGMPNVGKSSLINSLRNLGSGNKKAVSTGMQPGVTRSVSGTPIKIVEVPKIYIFDAPGIMKPYTNDPEMSLRLALCGSVKDHLAGPINLAEYLVWKFRDLGESKRLSKEFSLPLELFEDPSIPFLSTMSQICLKIGAMKKGSVPDFERAANFMVQGFRLGKFGRITLDQFDEKNILSVTSYDETSIEFNKRNTG